MSKKPEKLFDPVIDYFEERVQKAIHKLVTDGPILEETANGKRTQTVTEKGHQWLREQEGQPPRHPLHSFQVAYLQSMVALHRLLELDSDDS
jgi:hypothetical protein